MVDFMFYLPLITVPKQQLSFSPCNGWGIRDCQLLRVTVQDNDLLGA